MAQEQRFELMSTLGRGGMAEVFLGWMHSVGGLRRRVAIKRILPDLIQKNGKLYQQMFVDEARLAFQLEHDNIVRVYDVGQTANTFFIVMEYIEGFDLKRIMERMRASQADFPIGVAIYIILQVCAGLGYAHALTDDEGKPFGLIHNDISPPNILVGRYGEVKVSDFGLSDARSNNVETPEGMIKGKFAYISPESTQSASKISSRSDIFSIGIVFWEMLAGRKLFQRDTDIDTFRAVRDAMIPDIRKIRPDVPVDLVKILHKALAADPDNRYQTCEDLYHDLSTVANALRIPVNRYDLSWIVNDMAGNHWATFVGEKVSGDVQKDLEAELGGMLPPGEAEALKDLVTGMRVADDHSMELKTSDKKEDWIADVFNDVGFDEGDVVFKKEGDTAAEAKKAPPPVPPKTQANKTDSKKTPLATATVEAEAKKTKSNSSLERHDFSGLLPSDRNKAKFTSSSMTAPPPSSKALILGVAGLSFLIGMILSLVLIYFGL